MYGICSYFNDLTLSPPDEVHCQALATLKSRLCGSDPAMAFVAIASRLARAFALCRMLAKDGPTDEAG